jgi:hypothetical protein
VVTGVGQVEDRERLGGLAGRQEQRRDAAFQCGDALLDDVLGGIADTGVDVAFRLEPEQSGGMVGAVEGRRPRGFRCSRVVSPVVMGRLGWVRRTQRQLRTPDLRLSSLGARHNGPALAGNR